MAGWLIGRPPSLILSPHGHSQPSEIPVPWDLTPSLASKGTAYTRCKGIQAGKYIYIHFVLFCFSSQGFSVALESVWNQFLQIRAGFKLTEIPLPLTPKCWKERCAQPPPASEQEGILHSFRIMYLTGSCMLVFTMLMPPILLLDSSLWTSPSSLDAVPLSTTTTYYWMQSQLPWSLLCRPQWP